MFVGRQLCPSHLFILFFFFLLSWAFVFTIALALSYTFCLSCQINTWMTGEPRPWGIALAEWDGSICVRAPAERRGCWEHTAQWETLHWWRRGDLVLFNLPKSVPSASPLTLLCQNCCLVLDLAGWINTRNQHDMWAEKSKRLTSVVDFLVKMCYSDVPIKACAPTRDALDWIVSHAAENRLIYWLLLKCLKSILMNMINPHAPKMHLVKLSWWMFREWTEQESSRQRRQITCFGHCIIPRLPLVYRILYYFLNV